MWCDRFDGDLYALVPQAREVLAPLAEVKLWTTGHETGGKLNHPSVWNGDTRSVVAFFGLEPEPPHPSWYYTSNPLVACTLEEAARDLWAHGPAILRLKIPGHGYFDLWDSGEVQQSFWRLLFLARGSQLPRHGNADQEREHVLANLRELMQRVRDLGLLPADQTAAPATGAA